MPTHTNPLQDLAELDRDVTRAEVDGNVATLDALATDDFTLVGPVGFVLDKQQWLDRYRGGGLRTTALADVMKNERFQRNRPFIADRHQQALFRARCHGAVGVPRETLRRGRADRALRRRHSRGSWTREAASCRGADADCGHRDPR